MKLVTKNPFGLTKYLRHHRTAADIDYTHVEAVLLVSLVIVLTPRISLSFSLGDTINIQNTKTETSIEERTDSPLGTAVSPWRNVCISGGGKGDTGCMNVQECTQYMRVCT